MARSFPIDVVKHQLRLFGLSEEGQTSLGVLDRPGAREASLVRAANSGSVFLLLRPNEAFSREFGVNPQLRRRGNSCFQTKPGRPPLRLRTLHNYECYDAMQGEHLLSDEEGRAVWLKIELANSTLLFIGTDFVGDIVRYRQGDPSEVARRRYEGRWGFEFERPNYLFEAQREGELPRERHADNWGITLANVVSEALASPLYPILPSGARGAVVFTGDDDQAYLEKYRSKSLILGACRSRTFFIV